MIKPCLICGDQVNVPEAAEIACCGNELCELTIENSIGLHYVTPINQVSTDEPS